MSLPATQESPTCCLLTPPGVGAIAVIAVRGVGSWPLVCSCVSRPSGDLPTSFQTGRLYFGIFGDGKELIDEVIVCPLTDDGGNSIGADISAHGGIRVVERILMTLTSRGAELISTDGVGHDARVQSQIQSDAHRRMRRCTTRRSVMFLMSQAELLPAAYARIIDQANAGDVAEALTELKAIIDRSKHAHRLHTPAKITVLGPPNAGKSSLVNALAGRHHAVVTDIEGTTRDWVTVPAVFDGIEVTLIDTAGLRDIHDDLEQTAIQRGRHAAAESDLSLWVFDGSTDARDDGCLPYPIVSEKSIFACNKSDLGTTKKWRAFAEKISTDVVYVSAESGDGLDELRETILKRLGLAKVRDNLPTEFERECLQIMSELYRTGQDSDTSLASRMQDILGLR